MDNLPYYLALNRIHGVGARSIQKIRNRYPNLKDFFNFNHNELTDLGFSSLLASRITSFDFKIIEEDLSWKNQSERHHLLCLDDADYPPLLKEIPDPPPILYAVGNKVCLNNPIIGMVGTRKPSFTGSETSFQFAYDLAKLDITIASGLALGIDAKAHQGALAGNGFTIAVLGTGIDVVYPRQNKQLAEKIVLNGLLLSEFPLKTSPFAGHFPRRNRIISGLSLAILVVEAAVKSGSLITARLALEQNRDVLAIPGSILNPQSQGCHVLLQQGAKLVTSLTDILEELNIKQSIQPTRKVQLLARDDENLVKCIGFEITTVDQIIRRSGLTFEEVASVLVTLELKGLVKAIPGGYMRCS